MLRARPPGGVEFLPRFTALAGVVLTRQTKLEASRTPTPVGVEFLPRFTAGVVLTRQTKLEASRTPTPGGVEFLPRLTFHTASTVGVASTTRVQLASRSPQPLHLGPARRAHEPTTSLKFSAHTTGHTEPSVVT